MSVDLALFAWEGLGSASPQGCRIHLSGGEPFGDWDTLIDICRRAKAAGLLARAPLDKVETNAFWAIEENEIRSRLKALDEAGMGKIGISADPYHQQFVPIERCRLLARLAEDVLGAGRVQVRWRDWLEDGYDTSELEPANRRDIFIEYARRGRERFNGRAAENVFSEVNSRQVSELTDNNCREQLLRSRHVHVGPDGEVMAGTCAGIILGRIGPASVAEVWRKVEEDHAGRPVLGRLAEKGPCDLMEEAVSCGFVPDRFYANKCQICWRIRKHLAMSGRHLQELGPAGLYRQD